jgi:hypothetical protein
MMLLCFLNLKRKKKQEKHPMDLRQVKVYVISPATGKYENRLRNTLSTLQQVGFQNIEHVRSVPDENHTNSLSRTNLLIFEKEQNNTGPFIIMEDDIQVEDLITDDMWHLTIPEDAVAVYLGVSLWVYPYEYHTLSCGKHIRFITPEETIPYDERLVLIRGMSSAHAILFLDRPFLHTLSLCIRSYLSLRTPHDLILATLQQYYQMYALKQPFFYQDIKEGGQQLETRLIWLEDKFYVRL